MVLPSSATFFSDNCLDDCDDDDRPLLEVLLLLPLLPLQLLSDEGTEASSLVDSVDSFSTPDLASLTGTKDDDTAAAVVKEVATALTFSVGFSTTCLSTGACTGGTICAAIKEFFTQSAAAAVEEVAMADTFSAGFSTT
jgi:hypothetical protein